MKAEDMTDAVTVATVDLDGVDHVVVVFDPEGSTYIRQVFDPETAHEFAGALDKWGPVMAEQVSDGLAPALTDMVEKVEKAAGDAQ